MLSQRYVVSLIALIALVGLVGCSGCLFPNPFSKPASSEPVVGIWVWTSSASGTIYTDTFVSDGTYLSTSSDSSVSTQTGTWSKIKDNEYLVKLNNGDTYTWIYHPATDTITQPEYPNVPSYRQGKQPATTRVVTTTPTVRSSQDPIIGTWRYSGSTEFRIKFSSYGTTQETNSGSNYVISGTWKSLGNNRYLVTHESGSQSQWTYQPYTVTIYENEYPSLIYYPYSGSVYFS
jgi:hypothetical protein